VQAHFSLSYVLRYTGMLEQSERECDNAIALACLIHEGWDFGWREYWSEEIARSEE